MRHEIRATSLPRLYRKMYESWPDITMISDMSCESAERVSLNDCCKGPPDNDSTSVARPRAEQPGVSLEVHPEDSEGTITCARCRCASSGFDVPQHFSNP